MSQGLFGKKVLLGITGGIAAYKGPLVVRALVAAGCEVQVVVTRSARHFVAPLALQAVSGNAVGQDLFDPAYEHEIGHIELARWADVILVAPATAHFIGKIAGGLCDDLLSTIICATEAPVVVAPAMNTQMWRHLAVVDNVARLRERLGYTIVPPDAGALACGEVGAGRMPDPEVLVGALAALYGPRPLQGRRVLVTAGPTCEDIDPVRFITNRSSGKMGYAIASAFANAGADVVLVSGPTALAAPAGVERVGVRSTAQMRDEVFSRAVDEPADVVVKAAAVADYRPASAAEQKIKKAPGPMTIALERTTDILAELCALPESRRPFLVGFAAETQNVQELARAKMARKPVDLLVANIVSGPSSAFGADVSSVYFVTRDAEAAEGSLIEPFGPAPKSDIAAALVARVVRRLDANSHNSSDPSD